MYKVFDMSEVLIDEIRRMNMERAEYRRIVKIEQQREDKITLSRKISRTRRTTMTEKDRNRARSQERDAVAAIRSRKSLTAYN